jgi:DGQHR domain-containing protein
VKYLIDEDGTFPNSILLNVRGRIEFRPSNSIDDAGEFGILSIPTSSLPFWIIDGQHRLMAIGAASIRTKDFDAYGVPACIINLGQKYEEMRQFYVVNSRQKSVSTDLVQRHLYRSIQEKGEWKVSLCESAKKILAAEAVPITDILNNDCDSVWYNRIQMPGMPKSPNHIVRQTSMADSIGYILKTFSPVERDDVRRDPCVLAIPLKKYWDVIRSFFPEAFGDPNSYVIQKTTGCYVFHMIFPIIWEKCKADDDFSEEKMKGVLEEMLSWLSESEKIPIDSTFWHGEYGHSLIMGTSMKVFRSLASRLATPFMFPE